MALRIIWSVLTKRRIASWAALEVESHDWKVALDSPEFADIPPVEGASCIVRTWHHGEPVTDGWLFFEPALPYLNGWEDHPDDLPRCALVQLRNSHAVEVVPISDFRKRFRARPCHDLGRLSEDTSTLACVRSGRFVFVIFRRYEAGAWLIAECEDDRAFALAYGEWHPGEDRTVVGNGEIDSVVWRNVTARFAPITRA